MPIVDDSLYPGREQTLIKHYILSSYLQRFAHIIGSWKSTITYVDCFAGPWKQRSSDLTDTSFSIAIRELKKAQETHRCRGTHISLRCFFIEENQPAFVRLQDFAAKQTGVDIETFNGAFEDAVPQIVKFVQAGGGSNFTFVFIDPTGWTGFGMKTIAPLLQLKPSEALINFMTGHIRRFVETEEAAAGFTDLFGDPGILSHVRGLSGEDRDDALVDR